MRKDEELPLGFGYYGKHIRIWKIDSIHLLCHKGSSANSVNIQIFSSESFETSHARYANWTGKSRRVPGLDVGFPKYGRQLYFIALS